MDIVYIKQKTNTSQNNHTISLKGDQNIQLLKGESEMYFKILLKNSTTQQVKTSSKGPFILQGRRPKWYNT